jgi:twinkle protein
MEGIQELVDVESNLDFIFNNGLQKGATVGIPSLDKILSFKTGMLNIVTGVPSHGKTFALNYLLARLNILHGWKMAFFSPEFYPVSTHIAQVIETLGGQRFSSKNYTKSVYEVMKEYMCKNMFWIDPDETDIQSVMDRAKYLIRKKGIKVLVIDPFNALTDKTKKNQKQDEYISDFLQKLRWFARKYDVAIFLVMHPTKLLKLENGLYPVCDLYNCKGASEIFDKADIGLTVWRNEQEDYAEIHVTKIKFRHLGEKGKAAFKFNIQNGRYVEIADPDELRRQGVDIRTMPVSWDNSNYILAKLNNQEEQVSFVLPSVEPQSNEFATNEFDPFGSEDDSPF